MSGINISVNVKYGALYILLLLLIFVDIYLSVKRATHPVTVSMCNCPSSNCPTKVCSTLVLPQQHVKDPGHSAKRAGGRLQLKTHIHSMYVASNEVTQ